ncbi:MAG: putative glycosyl hydrolase [Herbinix sp.]|jgi:GNAT superfamily N-acetyltransferase|nr:putative glycosyl hydrolase [Herbinix sp.]
MMKLSNTIKMIPFTHDHVEQARRIAFTEYEAERSYVKSLLQIMDIPDLSSFADFKRGVAAVEGDQLVGYMCFYPPVKDAFGTTNTKGTFSPIHAHGVIGENRELIYSLLYQEAAKVLVDEGIISHAIALYAHDQEAIKSFYQYGFGLRCMDAIRLLDELPMNDITSYTYEELPKVNWGKLTNFTNMLISHLGDSPTFMNFPSMSEEEFLEILSEDHRFFVAKDEEKVIAYMKIGNEGETFITGNQTMRNIVGAFCLPEYRGTGVYQNLLAHVIATLKKEGFLYLGVDFESFNPTARGFWLKHFEAYTNGVVRRIDEKSVKGNN